MVSNYDFIVCADKTIRKPHKLIHKERSLSNKKGKTIVIKFHMSLSLSK